MAKRNVLYRVHAGKRTEANCRVIFETTKESEAYRFISDLEKSDCDYDKIYVEKVFLNTLDKRDRYE